MHLWFVDFEYMASQTCAYTIVFVYGRLVLVKTKNGCTTKLNF